MENFISYDYKNIKPSDLSSKIILMIGRASDKFKRFYLGILAMEYIIREIPECEMKIISNLNNTEFLIDLVYNINLNKYIEFVDYTLEPENYYKNSSLHIFPTISESFGLVLCETKIFGIPNILLGLDYVSLSRGGTIIIYDEFAESIAKESLKILKNDKIRKIFGKEARLSTKKFNNQLLVKKWIKLFLSIYNGNKYYQILKNNQKKLSKIEALNLLKRQLFLIKKRKPGYQNITISHLLNFTFLQFVNISNNWDFNEF